MADQQLAGAALLLRPTRLWSLDTGSQPYGRPIAPGWEPWWGLAVHCRLLALFGDPAGDPAWTTVEEAP